MLHEYMIGQTKHAATGELECANPAVAITVETGWKPVFVKVYIAAAGNGGKMTMTSKFYHHELPGTVSTNIAENPYMLIGDPTTNTNFRDNLSRDMEIALEDGQIIKVKKIDGYNDVEPDPQDILYTYRPMTADVANADYFGRARDFGRSYQMRHDGGFAMQLRDNTDGITVYDRGFIIGTDAQLADAMLVWEAWSGGVYNNVSHI